MSRPAAVKKARPAARPRRAGAKKAVMPAPPAAPVRERHVVAAGAGRQRADKALAAAFSTHSRSALQRAFAAGLVLRCGRPIGQDDTVAPGDEITFSLPEIRPSDLSPRDIPLDILYEDRHLLVINKPAGMVVHPGAGTGGDTLVHALLSHCAGKLSGIGGVERPGIVHRLDKGTSGTIVVAKTDGAHRALAVQFAERSARKEYLALVLGVPELLSGSMRKSIGRDSHRRHRMAAFDPGGGGREARTDWTVVERYGDRAALLRCVLHTGRTHQIRVHLKSLGHVLLGDTVYGFKPGAPLPPIPRVMLHAERLCFTHPVMARELDLHAPLPADFTAVVRGLKRLK